MDLVLEEIGIEIIMLCIKKAKIQKQLNKCVTCSIRRLLSCLGFKKLEDKLFEIEQRIQKLKENQKQCKITIL
jgi:hypothetical protein